MSAISRAEIEPFVANLVDAMAFCRNLAKPAARLCLDRGCLCETKLRVQYRVCKNRNAPRYD